MTYWILLTAISVVLLLASEAYRLNKGVWAFKPLASFGFLGTAYFGGALQTAFGQWVFAALGLCLIGDVLLIPDSTKTFKAGIVSFLLGHILFAVSFVVFGIIPLHALIGAVSVLPISILVARAILPKVPAELKIPVIAYTLVISVMVALAAGTITTDARHLLLPAAIAFFMSDLSVSRDRFVSSGFVNKAWGLPLYYFAQIVFACAAAS